MFFLVVLVYASAVYAQADPCSSCSYPTCPVSANTADFDTNVHSLYGCLCTQPVLQEYASCRQCSSGLASLDIGAPDQAEAYCGYFQQDVLNGTRGYNDFRTLILSKPNYIDMQPVIEVYPDVRDKLGSYVVEYVDSAGLDTFNANYSSIFTWIDSNGPASFSSSVVASSTALETDSMSTSLPVSSSSHGESSTTSSTTSTTPTSKKSGNSQSPKLQKNFMIMVVIMLTFILL